MMPTLVYWLGFIAYSLVVVGMGYYIYRRERRRNRQLEANEFWDAKKDLSASSAGLSISASMMSISWSCVYGVQLFYWYGLSAAWLLAIPWLMAMLGFYLLIPRFRKLTAFSQPEMVGQRFGQHARQMLAVPLAFVFIIWCGAEIYASAIILAPLLQTSKHVMLLLMAGIVAAYSALGGFEADVSTDKVQYFLVAFFIATMAFLGVQQVLQHETVGTFFATLPSPPKVHAPATALFAAGAALIVLTFISYLPGWLVETDVWIRLQAARSAAKARQAVMIAATNSFIFVGLLPLIIGLAALYLYAGQWGDSAGVKRWRNNFRRVDERLRAGVAERLARCRPGGGRHVHHRHLWQCRGALGLLRCHRSILEESFLGKNAETGARHFRISDCRCIYLFVVYRIVVGYFLSLFRHFNDDDFLPVLAIFCRM
jgi:Na+/proline symporter